MLLGLQSYSILSLLLRFLAIRRFDRNGVGLTVSSMTPASHMLLRISWPPSLMFRLMALYFTSMHLLMYSCRTVGSAMIPFALSMSKSDLARTTSYLI